MPRSGAASTMRRTVSTPAGRPAARGRPRRVAQRPLPSMMMATWKWSLWSGVLCIVKLPGKKILRRRESLQIRRLGLHGARGVAHHLFEGDEIVEIAPPPFRGDLH